MGAIEHLTISLPVEEIERMRGRVAAGEFADIDEAVLEAWREFEAGDGIDETPADHARLKAKIEAAYDGWQRNPASARPLKQVIAELKLGDRSAR